MNQSELKERGQAIDCAKGCVTTQGSPPVEIVVYEGLVFRGLKARPSQLLVTNWDGLRRIPPRLAKPHKTEQPLCIAL